MIAKICFALLGVSCLLIAEEAGSTAETWQSLFDGETLVGWTNDQGEPMKEGKWVAEDGVLRLTAGGGGALFSEKEYGDFEFSFEWNISEKGNSGVKYRLKKFEGKWLGLEYQVLDDEGHPDGKNGADRQAAALYDLKPAKEGKPVNPVGEWNTGRIVVKDGVVSHYLNGEQVIRLEIPSEEWKECFEASKYKKIEGFGVNEKGFLHLQDHGDEVAYRNLRLREFTKE